MNISTRISIIIRFDKFQIKGDNHIYSKTHFFAFEEIRRRFKEMLSRSKIRRTLTIVNKNLQNDHNPTNQSDCLSNDSLYNQNILLLVSTPSLPFSQLFQAPKNLSEISNHDQPTRRKLQRIIILRHFRFTISITGYILSPIDTIFKSVITSQIPHFLILFKILAEACKKQISQDLYSRVGYQTVLMSRTIWFVWSF